MKILIVDDSQEQIETAINQLGSDHEVVVAKSWNEAATLLASYDPEMQEWKHDNHNGFDVVLTDLMMPNQKKWAKDTVAVGSMVPYGFNVALLALGCDVKKIAVVSNGQAEDGNHHNHPILAACDSLDGFNFQDRLMFFVGYECPHLSRPQKGDISDYFSDEPSMSHLKDWRKVLSIMLGTSS